MKTIDMLGLGAFIATGTGLILTSLLKQTGPWIMVAAVIAVGYFFGLYNYYKSMCRNEVKKK
ncbi:MAG: hypothetical protein GX349_02365 [Firmicutes bacterium]|nr:hypothetical protein [Bacillota bacterium]